MCAAEKSLAVFEVPVKPSTPKGKLVKFPRLKSKSLFVAIPDGALAEDYAGIIITDNSLAGDGIFEGDAFVYCSRFSPEDITADTICAVYIAKTKHYLAKKVIFSGDKITLRSSNERFPDRTFNSSEVKIKGVYYAVMKF